MFIPFQFLLTFFYIHYIIYIEHSQETVYKNVFRVQQKHFLKPLQLLNSFLCFFGFLTLYKAEYIGVIERMRISKKHVYKKHYSFHCNYYIVFLVNSLKALFYPLALLNKCFFCCFLPLFIFIYFFIRS